jgi:hypothetical protein
MFASSVHQTKQQNVEFSPYKIKMQKTLNDDNKDHQFDSYIQLLHSVRDQTVLAWICFTHEEEKNISTSSSLNHVVFNLSIVTVSSVSFFNGAVTRNSYRKRLHNMILILKFKLLKIGIH